MKQHPPLRRTAAAAIAALALALPLAAQPASAQLPTSARAAAVKPTIVLVHGAFADASGWNDVITRLQAKGFTTYAPANPLRGLTSDADYLASFLSTIEGPIVLVAHSYGGAVITNAATGNPHVKALVYIAAYALDEGENVAAANELGGGHTDLLDHIVVRPFPGAAEGDADVYVEPSAFRRIFAQDLPRKETAVMAATQRPGAFAALVTPSGEPAWKTIPSWYMVARQDHLIPPVAEQAMAARAGARTQTIDSSHVAMMSHPGLVTGMVVRAVNATD